MIYLSLLELDPADAGARRLLGSPYAVHQRLLQAWEDGAFRASGATQPRMLFRVEDRADPLRPEARYPAPRILVQAPIVADWGRGFPEGRGLARPAQQKPVDEALAAICKGQHLRFRLRANPTRREPGRHVVDPRTGKPKDGPRVSVANAGPRRDAARQALEAELRYAPSGSEINRFLFEQWLRQRFEEAGATCLDVETTDEGLVVEQPRGLKLQSVLFEGRLRVENSEALVQTVQSGIGTAKGFGFGLLSLAPVK